MTRDARPRRHGERLASLAVSSFGQSATAEARPRPGAAHQCNQQGVDDDEPPGPIEELALVPGLPLDAPMLVPSALDEADGPVLPLDEPMLVPPVPDEAEGLELPVDEEDGLELLLDDADGAELLLDDTVPLLSVLDEDLMVLPMPDAPLALPRFMHGWVLLMPEVPVPAAPMPLVDEPEGPAPGAPMLPVEAPEVPVPDVAPAVPEEVWAWTAAEATASAVLAARRAILWVVMVMSVVFQVGWDKSIPAASRLPRQDAAQGSRGGKLWRGCAHSFVLCARAATRVPTARTAAQNEAPATAREALHA